MIVPAEIFRAYDIRGVVTDKLTPEVVLEIGKAFGSECRDKGVSEAVVARDGRLSGSTLVESLSKGIQHSGVDVIDIGMVPTPTLYFSTFHLDTGTGIMVTGSHNPPDYNGLKMMIAGDTLSGDAVQNLYHRIQNQNFANGSGSFRRIDILQSYLDRICEDVKLTRPLKVGLDCGNGVTGVAAPRLISRLGCETRSLYSEVDGNFPNHHPDPAEPANLEDLVNLVKTEALDIGLAFDGDGDRVGVIDNLGNVIWPDRQMILFSRDLLSRNPGARIIYDVKCSRLLPQAIQSSGGNPEMWKTGHSFIKTRIKETGALLGGEMSGHIFFKERWFGFDDALYTAARLLEIISAQSKTTSDLFAEIPDSVNTPELNIRFDNDGDHHEFMKEFLARASFPEADITTIDGLRADFENGWGLVRASNTTPSLVIRFEANDNASMSAIKEEFRSTMLEILPDLDIPF